MRIINPDDIKAGHFITFSADTTRLYRNKNGREIRLIERTGRNRNGAIWASTIDVLTNKDAKFAHISDILGEVGDEVYETKKDILNKYPEDFL